MFIEGNVQGSREQLGYLIRGTALLSLVLADGRTGTAREIAKIPLLTATLQPLTETEV